MFTCEKCHDRMYKDRGLCFLMPSHGPCEWCHKVNNCSDCHGSHTRQPKGVVELAETRIQEEVVEKLKKIEEELSDG